MSDRCTMMILCRPEDADALKTLLEIEHNFDEDIHDDGLHGSGLTHLNLYEANYGLYTEIEAAADKGIMFVGNHGAGGEYGSGVFACDGKQVINCDADADCYPTVRVMQNGSIDDQQLSNARAYQELYKQVYEALTKKG